MSVPDRMTVKFFVQDPAALDLTAFVPVFQRWIQEHTVPGLLLDVADYKHVIYGPGIVLIGDEGDYALDLGGGRPGLLYRRKRHWDALDGATSGLQGRLRSVLRLALTACAALEAEPILDGHVTFKLGEMEFSLPDRLHTPNGPEQMAALQAAVEPLLSEVYGSSAFKLEAISQDPRRPLALRAAVAAAPDLATLLDRLQPVTSSRSG